MLKEERPVNTRHQLIVLGILLVIEVTLVFVTYTWFLESMAASLPSTPSVSLPLPAWLFGLASAGIILVVYGGLGLVGYWFARKLGWPGVFREHAGWRAWFFQPLIIGCMLGIILVVSDRFFALVATRNLLVHPTFPVSLIAAMSAGIGEEVLFRLFVLSFWAFLLHLLLGRWVQKGVVFWTANSIAALAFGAGHLPTVMALYGVTDLAGIPPLVLVEVFLLNGVLGLIAGVRYHRDGLVAASGIHFWADIVWHVVWPLLLGL